MQLPGGQSRTPASANYLDWLPDYLSNTPRPLLFDIAAAQSAAVDTFVLSDPN
ncbi:MAG: hypothetical protein R3A47_09240 [Polyangiales bacterium]